MNPGDVCELKTGEGPKVVLISQHVWSNGVITINGWTVGWFGDSDLFHTTEIPEIALTIVDDSEPTPRPSPFGNPVTP